MSNNVPDYENNLAFDPDINTMPRCDIEALKSEVKRLKELLKECKIPIDLLMKFNVDDINGYKLLDLLIKIDNAIGEKID